MWKPEGMSWRKIIRTTVREFTRNGLDARSAQFAYYSLLLLPPTLILLITFLARLPVGALDQIVDGVRQALPQGAFDVVADQVASIRTQGPGGLFWLALGVGIVSGAGLFVSVGRGVNTAFGVEETRPLWKVYGIALLLGAACFVLLLGSSALVVLGPAVDEAVAEHVDAPLLHFFLSNVVGFLVLVVAALLATSVAYWILPNVHRRWKLITPGSVLAVGVWLVLSYGFRIYVDNYSTYNETYGAIAGVIILMVWMYGTGMTFYAGAQLNALIRAHAPTEDQS